MAFELGNVVKHEWLVRFPDDVKARPRELSVVTRISALLVKEEGDRQRISKRFMGHFICFVKAYVHT